MSLVIINDVEVHLVSRDGSIFANSLEVASVFGKEHAKVIRSIESMSKRGQSNFGVTSYIDGSNRNQKMYEMNRDGFMFLTMGFTGEKAENWKLDLIDAFNEMERQIKEPKILTIPEQIAIIAKGNQIIDERLTILEKTKKLEYWQEKSLQDAKNAKVYSIANDDKKLASVLHRKVWSLFKKHFHLPRYNELPAIKYEDGISYLRNLTLADLVA